MYPGGFNNELWIELLWEFMFILIIPVAATLILLTITIIVKLVSRFPDQRPRRNKA